MQQSIVIDASHLENSNPTGVEHYTAKLLPLLSGLLAEAGLRVYWLGHTSHTSVSLPKGTYWQYAPYRRGWGQLQVPKILRQMRAGAYFTPSGIVPLQAPCPVAMTVHDISVFDSPESYSISQKWRLRYLNRLAAKRSGAIMVPSDYTKHRVADLWQIPQDSIHVTPLAAERDQVEPEPIQGIDPSRPSVVFVGRLETKKNLKPVLQAMACSPLPEFQMILGGKPGVGSRELYNLIPALKEGGRSVYLPGFVNAAQRRWLFEMASVMVVPGLYEGFGLPVLEAFAYNLPCICSKAGSLPEVGGEAVLYVDEQTPQDWRKAMDTAVYDQETRQRLLDKGKRRIKKYSWERTAELTRDALLNLI